MRRSSLFFVAIGLIGLASGVLLLTFEGDAETSSPLERTGPSRCGDIGVITIAEMTWLSASAMAHIVETFLTVGYGCNAEIVPGDTVPTLTAMAQHNEPTIAPELWLSTAEAMWAEAADKGDLYKAGDVFAGGGEEGWWIPDYIAEAHRGLRAITDVADHKDLFVEPASDGLARIYGCPPSWGCAITNQNLFRAMGLEGRGFQLHSPGSGANLAASIGRKVARKDPVLAYYWGPTAVIGKYNLVRLDMPPVDDEKFRCLTDKDCESPELTGWKRGEVAVVATTALRDGATEVAAFLSKLQVSNAAISAALAWGDAESATGEEVAEHYLRENLEEWADWAPAEVIAAVKATL